MKNNNKKASLLQFEIIYNERKKLTNHRQSEKRFNRIFLNILSRSCPELILTNIYYYYYYNEININIKKTKKKKR